MSDVEFERRVARALRAAVPSNARAKVAIMDKVRRASSEGSPRRMLALPLGRASRQSLIGLAMAAGIGSITTMSALSGIGSGRRVAATVSSAVIGDSVVEGFRDTLRLVRLMFNDAGARQVAVAGDFNGWKPEMTPMQRDKRSGDWSVTLALPDGSHRYAIVVDATRWAGDSALNKGADAPGHVYSLLHVARTTN
ncbi:MAG: hypothetical protein ABJE47_12645 [bacterium]